MGILSLDPAELRVTIWQGFGGIEKSCWFVLSDADGYIIIELVEKLVQVRRLLSYFNIIYMKGVRTHFIRIDS
jgi:hypothetical protein